jgi:hypothetical protein
MTEGVFCTETTPFYPSTVCSLPIEQIRQLARDYNERTGNRTLFRDEFDYELNPIDDLFELLEEMNTYDEGLSEEEQINYFFEYESFRKENIIARLEELARRYYLNIDLFLTTTYDTFYDAFIKYGHLLPEALTPTPLTEFTKQYVVHMLREYDKTVQEKIFFTQVTSALGICSDLVSKYRDDGRLETDRHFICSGPATNKCMNETVKERFTVSGDDEAFIKTGYISCACNSLLGDRYIQCRGEYDCMDLLTYVDRPTRFYIEKQLERRAIERNEREQVEKRKLISSIAVAIEPLEEKESIEEVEIDRALSELIRLSIPVCPNCKAQFLDWTNCYSVECASCKKDFCGVCLRFSGTSTETHRHIRMDCKKHSQWTDPQDQDEFDPIRPDVYGDPRGSSILFISVQTNQAPWVMTRRKLFPDDPYLASNTIAENMLDYFITLPEPIQRGVVQKIQTEIHTLIRTGNQHQIQHERDIIQLIQYDVKLEIYRMKKNVSITLSQGSNFPISLLYFIPWDVFYKNTVRLPDSIELFRLAMSNKIDEDHYMLFINALQKAKAVVAGGSVLTAYLYRNEEEKDDEKDQKEEKTKDEIQDLDVYIHQSSVYEFVTLLFASTWKIKNRSITHYNGMRLERNHVMSRITLSYDAITMDVMIVPNEIPLQKAIDQFDLSCCQITFDGASFSSNVWDDIFSRKAYVSLSYLDDISTFRYSIYKRMVKYKRRGFRIIIQWKCSTCENVNDINDQVCLQCEEEERPFTLRPDLINEMMGYVDAKERLIKQIKMIINSYSEYLSDIEIESINFSLSREDDDYINIFSSTSSFHPFTIAYTGDEIMILSRFLVVKEDIERFIKQYVGPHGNRDPFDGPKFIVSSLYELILQSNQFYEYLSDHSVKKIQEYIDIASIDMMMKYPLYPITMDRFEEILPYLLDRRTGKQSQFFDKTQVKLPYIKKILYGMAFRTLLDQEDDAIEKLALVRQTLGLTREDIAISRWCSLFSSETIHPLSFVSVTDVLGGDSLIKSNRRGITLKVNYPGSAVNRENVYFYTIDSFRDIIRDSFVDNYVKPRYINKDRQALTRITFELLDEQKEDNVDEDVFRPRGVMSPSHVFVPTHLLYNALLFTSSHIVCVSATEIEISQYSVQSEYYDQMITDFVYDLVQVDPENPYQIQPHLLSLSENIASMGKRKKMLKKK